MLNKCLYIYINVNLYIGGEIRIVGIRFEGLVLADKQCRLEGISKFKLAYPYMRMDFGEEVAEELLNRMKNKSNEIQIIYDILNMLCDNKQLPICPEKLKALL